jgi:hypothetical protein
LSLFFRRAQTAATETLTGRKFMKLKMIVVLSLAVAALAVVGAACSHSPKESAPVGGQTVAYYTCPMHPSVKADKPGACSICGMTLMPVYTNTPTAKP